MEIHLSMRPLVSVSAPDLFHRSNSGADACVSSLGHVSYPGKRLHFSEIWGNRRAQYRQKSRRLYRFMASFQENHMDGSSDPNHELMSDPVGISLSLRDLKRQKHRKKLMKDDTVTGIASCSIKKAFSSMVFMIRTLQSHTLRMRHALCRGTDFHSLSNLVQRELHSSFVWLFQQVFACTPSLMVSVMILLANFTAYSIGEHDVVYALQLQNPVMVSVLQNAASNEGVTSFHVPEGIHVSDSSDIQAFSGCGSGRGNSKNIFIAGGADGENWFSRNSDARRMVSREEVSASDTFISGRFLSDLKDEHGTLTVLSSKPDQSQYRVSKEDSLLARSLMQEASLDLGTIPHMVPIDRETLKILVAPVISYLEPDDYECYDKTDLIYQHALSTDPENPLLLANYAEFLHLVRHDHNRAHEFFKKAIKANPTDGQVINRYASFLWLGKGDREGAEKAYRAAMAVEPTNPFHAGSYAQFLWNAPDGETAPYPYPTFQREA